MDAIIVSVSDRRASPREKIAALSRTRDAEARGTPGLHSYAMVNATLAGGCHCLGRIPANVKFEVEKVLNDGSYLSLIYPDGKSKKKGSTKIQVRVIEYTIDVDGQQQSYRLITSLIDVTLFPALLLASEYHQRWEA